MTNFNCGKTTPLRQRMTDRMRMAGMADNTVASYLGEIRRLANHYGTSPDQLDAEQIGDWLMMRIDLGVAPGSTNIRLAALRFLYRDVLRRPDLVGVSEPARYRANCRGISRLRRSSAC